MYLEGPVIKSFRFLLGVSFQALYFIFLYYVMPSKKLNFKSICIGGMVASILLELVQYINVAIAKGAISADPSKIYGTVPLIAVLFFAWIRLGWLVTLIGAACSLAAQKILYFDRQESLKDFPAKEMIQCITIYCSISKIYKSTGFPVPLNKILSITNIPLVDIKKWIEFLMKRGVIFTSNIENIACYSPSYKAIQDENNVEEFLKNILFLNQSNSVKNYNDIEKYFVLCLKGVSLNDNT